MTAEPNPYIALELAPGSSLEQVKEQYRRLAKEHHPDLNPQDRARSEERLRRLNAAYAVLSDPAHKAMLDFRWEQTQTRTGQARDSGARAGRRPAPHPRPVGMRDAKRQRPKAAKPNKAARPLTREERKRVRITATSLGLAMSLTIVGIVYYEWAQPTPPNRIGIAPSLSAGFDGRAGARTIHWSPSEPAPVDPTADAPASDPTIGKPSSDPMAGAPASDPAASGTPAADDAPVAVPSAGDQSLQNIKLTLQRRMDGVEPKITALAAEAQSETDADTQPPSTRRLQWRTRLLTDARQMLLQRDTIRLQIEDLSLNQPQARQSALTRINLDSQRLQQQYRHVSEELRQKPL